MSANDTPDLLPVRMLNEYAFCPRLFHLMHVNGRWDDNFYTDQGRSVHRRTDAADDPLPPPDETRLLAAPPAQPGDIRRLYPARDDALPLYVQEQGARVGKSGESLHVAKGTLKLGEFPLKDVSQLVLCGNVSISAQCLHLLCDRSIPVVHLSMGHWFYGVTAGIGLRNAYDRAAQFAAAADDGRRLALARAFVLLRGWGERVQYSVFCCQLNPRERLKLIDELKARMHQDEDQTLFVDAGPVEGERPVPEIAYLGKVWRPEQRTQVV